MCIIKPAFCTTSWTEFFFDSPFWFEALGKQWERRSARWWGLRDRLVALGRGGLKGSHGVCWVWAQLFWGWFFLGALFLELSKIRSRKEGENPALSFRGCV